ncbi:PspC domain-containing protein [Candidatus Nomurabacteria bacterium]|nr:PspC domain-containing protein [Candidatus Nomurabacteria bacterium]
MKKVINITIGSVVFAIEQEAYDILVLYLEQIKSNLASSDDAQEIIEDVERAIAEKFIAQKKNEKIAVTPTDVELVISEMGSPADFGEGENPGERVDGSEDTEQSGDEPKKRLYRDTDDAIIAGIASGIARYFDIDPVIVRLVFVISIFFNGLGILAYIILWLVVPVATTTADKYAMRGERVTLKEITERVKKNIKSIEETDFETANGIWINLRNLLNKLFQVLGALVKFIIVLARYVVGIAFIVGGALGIAGMVSGYSVVLLSDKILFPEEVQIVLEIIQGSALGAVVIVSSFVALAIPLIVLIVVGASLLVKRNFFTVQKTVVLAVVWIVAVVVAGTTSALQIEQVVHKINSLERNSDNSSMEQGFHSWVNEGLLSATRLPTS